MHFEFILKNEQATNNFGAKLAELLVDILSTKEEKSLLIFLNGELGAGKTSLVRACLQSLGVKGAIKSPTYTLLEPYELPESGPKGLKIAHLDLYRLLEPEELDYIGGRNLKESFQIIFIEWPEKGLGALPAADINIQLNHIDTGRTLYLTSPNSEISAKVKSIKYS